MQAALHWHGDEYKAKIRSLYGSEVRMDCYDTLLVVDPHRIDEPAEA
jgi:hypothetical protein